MENNGNGFYKHYVAIDWSQEVVFMARMMAQAGRVDIKRFEPDVRAVKEYLRELRGSKILTIEETTGSHWLYVELKEYVERIIICDPYRNRLLNEGAKNDKIDAKKLCMLLRSGLLKDVYHSLEEDYRIRKLTSAYEDLVKAGVRVKNQRSALYRGEGLNHKKDRMDKSNRLLSFIEEQQQRSIGLYLEEKRRYEKEFDELREKNETVRLLTKISGIGTISAVKIYSTVIDAGRFENKYKYWSYCGLVRHQKESGGRNYGSRKTRYSRTLKAVYKTAALAAIGGKNDIAEYYQELLKGGRSFPEARNQIARYIAKVSYAVMKKKEKYRAYQWREGKADQE
jgi:transposase